MDVGDWLRSFGLGEYEPLFLENKIDVEVLPDLTDSDLSQFGVPFGHRKRLLKAIANLGATDSAAKQANPASPPSPQDSAERRQLTVMFCDLVGSTAMSARIDPEDMREVIGSYHRCCTTSIERNGGFVAKYMGDGVLAYFGYPQAHEHDAERAVQAGLAIVEAAPKLVTSAGSPLHVRVGIATGMVVVGDLIGSGEAQERGVVGETPNLAARLQAIAELDTVVIAEGTRRLLGNLFELRDLGAKDLKGIAGPARAWAALRPSSAESRFEALHATGLTVLVGREEEFDLLLRRWSKAKGGEGQVVLFSGEAGIGKSRLTAALLERVASEPHTRLRYFCSPQHTDSAFYPIVSQMERAAGLAHDDLPRARLDKLDTLLAVTATSREDAALFAEMLSLPNDSRYPVRELDPRQRRQKTMEALIGHIEAASRQSAVLMILEDAHWADPSSLEAFGRLVDRIDRLRVLLFVTFRPEFSAPWVGRSHVTALTINRLAPREVTALIEQVAGDRPLPSHLLQDIIERADGIPLFVEEMTKAVLEAESEGAAEHTAASVPSPALAVPASLHASLMARLDRLGPASREAAQIGAVIGREFSYELMLGVSRQGEAMTRDALDRLVAAGLVLQHGVPPTAEYQFKHALVQDIAYGTLLRAPRKALHARIVEAVRARTPETVARAPEVLARHLMEAGEFDSAATYWLEAGRRAIAQSADNEAAAHLARGISALSGLPDTPERDRKELALQLALGPALLSNQGYGNDVTTAYRRAVELAVRLGDDRSRFAAIWGLWISEARHVGTVDDPRRHLDQMVEIADGIGDPDLVLQAHHSAWTTWAHSGEFARSLEHNRKGMALYDPEKHRRHALVYGGHDPGVCGHGNRALAAWTLGYPDQAAQSARDGVALAETLDHMPSLLHSLWFSGTHYCLMRDFVAARDCGDRLLALGREHGLMLYQAIGGIVHGWALSQIRDGVNGLEELRSSFGRYSAGIKTQLEVYRAGLVEAELRAGNFERASASLLGIETGGAKYWGAELLRLRGDMQRSGPHRDEAASERSYREALRVAQGQQAKSLELRAATSLARLWHDQGRRAEAHDLLAPLYGWFTEGFDTLDLKETKALLDALAS